MRCELMSLTAFVQLLSKMLGCTKLPATARQDYKLSEEEVDWWVKKFKDLQETGGEAFIEREITINSGETIFVNAKAVCFGKSAETGRPLFLVVGEDMTGDMNI